jgi:hypothetical protein
MKKLGAINALLDLPSRRMELAPIGLFAPAPKGWKI